MTSVRWVIWTSMVIQKEKREENDAAQVEPAELLFYLHVHNINRVIGHFKVVSRETQFIFIIHIKVSQHFKHIILVSFILLESTEKLRKNMVQEIFSKIIIYLLLKLFLLAPIGTFHFVFGKSHSDRFPPLHLKKKVQPV